MNKVTKIVKNIDEQLWRKLKAEAYTNGHFIGIQLNKILEERYEPTKNEENN